MNHIPDTDSLLVFYSLNDKLDKNELSIQLKDFKAKGITGVFLHARAGLRTEYFSSEWFDCIEHCIKECESLDIEVWLYDENGWPSGFANFAVPNHSTDYCQKELKFTYLKEADPLPDNIIGIFSVNECSNTYCMIDEVSSVNENEKVLIVHYSINDQYSDLLNPSAVSFFIESTHEVYYSKFQKYFGNVIKGIFTDEPQMVSLGFPWSSSFSDSFESKYGYSITDMLPLLILQSGEASKVRHDFWSVCSTLYRENYHKQIYEWCDDHGIFLTGHMSSEDSTLYQMSTVGNVMANYQYYHIPGIDHLGNRLTSPILQKQVGSASRQLDKKTILSETFGCAGWDASIADCLRMWAWQGLSSINLPCLHLSAYSLKGTRKRDYPQFYSYQLPWWDMFPELASRMKEISGFVSEGEYISEVLVIHPNTSIWCDGTPSGSFLTTSISGDFRILTETLMKYQIPFDYGDEIIISNIGKVSDDLFCVGDCKYSMVILPHLTSLESGTVSLLKEYVKNGGKVIIINSMPYMIDGVVSSDGYRFLENPSVKVSSLIPNRLMQALNGTYKLFDLTDTNGNPALNDVYSRVTRTPSGYNIFIVNVSDHDTKKLLLSKGNVIRRFEIAPGDYESVSWDENYKTDKYKLIHEERLYKPAKLVFSDMNSLVIDHASFCINNTKSEGLHHTMKIQKKVFEIASLNKKGAAVEVNYFFTCDFTRTPSHLFLACESEDAKAVKCNGKMIERKGHYIDKSIALYDLSDKFLLKGENEITMIYDIPPYEISTYEGATEKFETVRNKFFYPIEIENIYLYGDFKLGGREASHKAGKYFTLSNDDIVLTDDEGSYSADSMAGRWFYRGNADFTYDFNLDDEQYDKVTVTLNDAFCSIAEIILHDHQELISMCNGSESDITALVKPGNNRMIIRMHGSNRNIFGPHHYKTHKTPIVGPSIFEGVDGWEGFPLTNEYSSFWEKDYVLVYDLLLSSISIKKYRTGE